MEIFRVILMSISKDFALFKDERNYIKTLLGDELWIRVYSFIRNSKQTIRWYCGLVKNNNIDKALKDANWELHIGRGYPGCSEGFHGGKRAVKYDRFGFCDAEPLVFIRDYSGFKKSQPEISEEFRFFHNLYYEEKRNEYLKINDSGEETTIVKYEPEAVLIRLKEIRQFLAIKESHLALYFDHVHRSDIEISSIPNSKRDELYKDRRTVYQFRIETGESRLVDFKTISFLYGKKLIKPYQKEKSEFWPYNEEKPENYPTFIIKETSDGDLKTYTCNPDELANNFGANRGSPHYLTPVFFKREVLQKYYSAPERYSVEDSLLRCGSTWCLQMDNHHEDVVIVYLGDLGRDLPTGERNYWRSFNMPPKGHLSKTQIMRDFMAQFCEPEGKDLKFKQMYHELNKKWTAKYGWPLFLPLKPEDAHFFQSLRVLINNNQSEFDSQILALTKVMIDALNELKIGENISKKANLPKGIAKFDIFLREKGYNQFEAGIDLLKLVQGIRSSGVAHLKGSNYEKLARKLRLTDRELKAFFSELLVKATKFFELLIHGVS
jgi:hypothetical protein